ncbi:hypothetical protein SUGI_0440820 [Cryptomeria japonica]|uniref:uncharacterized protein LOC131047440 n=1 Tax=Cryptomeria japonica TaxID=3369 RepID=UPI002408AD00|nr:uncharacterized protein LOC131047440 [Cryptomeria japonica]GLJ23301.1 hypothetical protein SUGI_0440820 [Cryptomeria japonica]
MLKDLVQKLLDGGVNPFHPDDEGKTALHYSAKGMAEKIIEGILIDRKQGVIIWEKASVGDKYGRNVLHVAVFLGRSRSFEFLLQGKRNMIDTKDRDGQSAIYYAVAGPHEKPSVLQRFLEAATIDPVFVTDFSQTTPLHVASARGNLKMVEELLSVISGEERKKNYVGSPYVMGQRALHKVASGGHWNVVEKLLEKGADPLKECDFDGKTALHFAAQADGEDAVQIAKLLLSNSESDKQRSFLLFASAGEMGLCSNSSLEECLQEETSKILEKNREREFALE